MTYVPARQVFVVGVVWTAASALVALVVLLLRLAIVVGTTNRQPSKPVAWLALACSAIWIFAASEAVAGIFLLSRRSWAQKAVVFGALMLVVLSLWYAYIAAIARFREASQPAVNIFLNILPIVGLISFFPGIWCLTLLTTPEVIAEFSRGAVAQQPRSPLPITIRPPSFCRQSLFQHWSCSCVSGISASSFRTRGFRLFMDDLSHLVRRTFGVGRDRPSSAEAMGAKAHGRYQFARSPGSSRKPIFAEL
jgi:hypothetical protein